MGASLPSDGGPYKTYAGYAYYDRRLPLCGRRLCAGLWGNGRTGHPVPAQNAEADSRGADQWWRKHCAKRVVAERACGGEGSL